MPAITMHLHWLTSRRLVPENPEGDVLAKVYSVDNRVSIIRPAVSHLNAAQIARFVVLLIFIKAGKQIPTQHGPAQVGA